MYINIYIYIRGLSAFLEIGIAKISLFVIIDNISYHSTRAKLARRSTHMAETIRERVVRLIGEMRNRTTDRGATPAEAAGFAAKVAEWI